MKNVFLSLLAGLFLIWSGNLAAEANPSSAPAANANRVIELNEDSFIQKVFDFRNSETWEYKGDRPAIVDFYAVWCGPCKQLAPILEELQSEYGEKIQIYKVDAEKNRELAAAFGVSAYPTMIFIPMDADPAGARGLLPKEELERIIADFLNVEK
ncbi:thioredoxin [Natronoflexus pectinivorans]|uniref:Thioredoxin n=1 Tax=Natronoflexus pectinivorans TaxID=682526 RepID=A0A4R2GF33_9BACT|nr:thioredoxin [Natronoflexus pectinivorans]TCO06805.1 thioredoxin [Natronoflexus pectinivorans]